MEESATADVYDLVYGSERPELFFKCAAWRAVTDGEPVGIRADSRLNVPEPELAVVANRFGEIVGYTVCDDVSSRSIEGANPLYLPQAKIYAGACALGSGIRPAWEVSDPAALDVELSIERGGRIAWRGTTNTARLRRTIADLLGYLFLAEQFPDGAVLSTGTGIVPEMDFTLREGDEVTIRIDQVGSLTNTVAAGISHFGWLASGGRIAGSARRREPMPG
jgi:2-dehydro-3-deoxy-D-arabinonate dehydratase